MLTLLPTLCISYMAEPNRPTPRRIIKTKKNVRSNSKVITGFINEPIGDSSVCPNKSFGVTTASWEN